ncbi:MAG: hypothetical protein AAF928_15380 [Myxococcota bacterium]
MKRRWRRLLGGTWFVLLPAACLFDPNGTGALDPGTGGGGDSTVSVGGTGGEGPPNCVAAQCPVASGPCFEPACDPAGACTEVARDAGSLCGDAGQTCDGAGNCVRPDGANCGEATACASGFCSDGVCCDTVCNGPCERCDDTPGVCGPAPAASVPKTSACAAVCDGLGGCAEGTLVDTLSFTGPDRQRGWAVAVEAASDDIVVVGQLLGEMTVDSQTLSADTGADPFVLKLSPDGTALRWGRVFLTGNGSGGDTENYARDVAIGPQGDVYVCGNFRDDIELTPGTVEDDDAQRDIFVVRLDGATGNTVWGEVFGGNGDDRCTGLTLDPNGDVVVVGINNLSIDFGGGALPRDFEDEGFVVKLDGANGAHLDSWAIQTGFDQRLYDVRATSDAIFIAGTTRRENPFDAAQMLNFNHSILVARLDQTGAEVWHHVFDSDEDNIVTELDVDEAGNVTVSGAFRGTLDFGTGNAVTANGLDAFVLRLDGSNGGATQWVGTFGGPGDQWAYAMAVGAGGDVGVGLEFTGSVTVGPDTLMADGRDSVLVRLGADGTFLWSRPHGGPGEESVEGLAVAAGNNNPRWVLTGWFTDALTVGSQTLNNADAEDLFITAHRP